MSNHDRNTRTGKRQKRLRKRVYILLAFILTLLLAVTGYGVHLYIQAENALTSAHDGEEREKSDLREDYVDPKFDNVSILVMGIDASEKRDNEDHALTDALMVATLNKDEKSVKLLSIPRDSYVYIPEVGYNTKINHAHAYGGPRATAKTVEELLDIPIDYYVRINFEAFMDVVDAVDGITVDVPYEFREQDSKDRPNQIHLLPGEQRLNGEEALALARTRKLDNDIERGKRQQEIVKALVSQATSLSSILKFDDIIVAVAENMKTDMSFKEMKSFISYGLNGNGIQLETLTLEGEDYQPAGTYYWKLDDLSLAETKDALREHLEIKQTVLDGQTDNHPEQQSTEGVYTN